MLLKQIVLLIGENTKYGAKLINTQNMYCKEECTFAIERNE